MDTRLYSSNHFAQWKHLVKQSLITTLDLSTKYEIHSGHKGPIHTMAVDALENRYILTGGNDCKISFYDLNAKEKSDLRTVVPYVEDVYKIYPLTSTIRSETLGHNFAVSSVEWFPNDLGAFISSSFDEKLNVWDTERMEIAGTFGLGSRIHIAAMHPQGIHNIVACGTANAGIRLCDLNTGDSSHVLGADSSTVMTVDWCPTSEFMVASGSSDGTVSIWDIRQGGYKALLTSMDYLQDAMSASNGIDSGSGRVIQSSTVNPQRRRKSVSTPQWNKHISRIAHSREVMSVKFSSCGHHLVSLGNDRNVRLWNVHSAKLYPIKYARGCQSRMRFQVDVSDAIGDAGDLFLYPDDNTGDILVTRLHSSSGEPIHTLRGHMDMVTAVKLMPDASVLSCGRDGMIFIWSPTRPDGEWNNIGTSAENPGYVAPQGDKWSDDEPDGTDGEGERTFQPAIFSMYRRDSANESL